MHFQSVMMLHDITFQTPASTMSTVFCPPLKVKVIRNYRKPDSDFLLCDCACPRFALVCVGSEASSRKLMELLSKRELHGQNPIVTPCNKQSLSQFEMQSRKSK